MLSFFWYLARRMPAFWKPSLRNHLAETSLLLFLLLLFNRQWMHRLLNREGISPWWSLAPVGLFFGYTALRAVHQSHVELEKELDALRRENQDLRRRLTQVTARQEPVESAPNVRERLQSFLEEGQQLCEVCETGKGDLPTERFQDWVSRVEIFLQDNLGSDAVLRFRRYEETEAGLGEGPSQARRELCSTLWGKIDRLEQFLEDLGPE
ncbi:MAG: hypothetical protein JO112_09840 [Planctomycetes bacterium]|nr:hypothetical protein [Planctomycetota bacterium]